jgi:hypothetical protein
MPIFGITASSNQSVKLTDFYQIATTTVGSGGATDITFSSIPADYTHLQIRYISRDSRIATNSDATIRFNGDSGSNYSNHVVSGDGVGASSGGSANTTNINIGNQSALNSAANTFGIGIIDILILK